MKLRYGMTLISAVAFLALGAGSARATITIVADYHLGEADPGAAPGNVSTGTVDSSGNGFNLTTVVGQPTYSSGGAFSGSSLSMSFNGSSYLAGPTVANATENFGIELFVKTSDPGQSSSIAINGSGCCSGFGLVMAGGEYEGLYGGINFIPIGSVRDNQWDEIALVNEGGTSDSFLNGVLTSSGDYGDPHPANGPICCSPPLNMTIGSDGLHDYIGDIDEVRVFTFAPGAFSPSDLDVPEPSTIALLTAGLIGLAFVRRKHTSVR